MQKLSLHYPQYTTSSGALMRASLPSMQGCNINKQNAIKIAFHVLTRILRPAVCFRLLHVSWTVTKTNDKVYITTATPMLPEKQYLWLDLRHCIQDKNNVPKLQQKPFLTSLFKRKGPAQSLCKLMKSGGTAATAFLLNSSSIDGEYVLIIWEFFTL